LVDDIELNNHIMISYLPFMILKIQNISHNMLIIIMKHLFTWLFLIERGKEDPKGLYVMGGLHIWIFWKSKFTNAIKWITIDSKKKNLMYMHFILQKNSYIKLHVDKGDMEYSIIG